MKRIFITGASGQDGSYLIKELLRDTDNLLFALGRQANSESMWRHQTLGLLGHERVKLIESDLLSKQAVSSLYDVRPNLIFNFAAVSSVSQSFENPEYCLAVNTFVVRSFLESIKKMELDCRFVQASSSEMYGLNGAIGRSEEDAFLLLSPYAHAKLLAHHCCEYERRYSGLNICSVILFSHKSILRHRWAVTKEIATYVSVLPTGTGCDLSPLKLGNIDLGRDWGYAPEFVRAISEIGMSDTDADSYVLGSGTMLTIRDLLVTAFQFIDKELVFKSDMERNIWLARDAVSGKILVNQDFTLTRDSDTVGCSADTNKFEGKFGWRPTLNCRHVISLMIEKLMLQPKFQ